MLLKSDQNKEQLYILNMNIPISEFEEYIDEIILGRGYDYYVNGDVISLKNTSTGYWEALVQGSSTYKLSLRVEDHMLTEHSCTCPYDFGPVCKHIAAALYQLEQLEGAGNGEWVEADSHADPEGSLKEMGQNCTKEELLDFICELAGRDETFKHQFLIRFTPEASGSKSYYEKIVHHALSAAEDAYGMIAYGDVETAMGPVEDLLNKAAQQTPNEIIPACQAIIENLTETLNHADDSDGYIYSAIEEATDLLKSVSDNNLTSKLREELLRFCLEEALHPRQEGWDAKWPLLQIAGQIAQEDEEGELFKALGQAVRKDGWSKDYESGKAALIKLDRYKRTRSEEEIQKFKYDNRRFETFRNILLKEAFDQKNYKQAKQLAKEGIETNQKNHLHGLVNRWHEWLLKIALAEHKPVEICRIAEGLYYNNHYNMDHYRLLKQHYPQEKWPEKLEKMIKTLGEGGWGFLSNPLADIFIEEKMHDRLMNMVRKDPSLSIISRYEPYLKKDYRQELIVLYEKGIINHLEYNTGREYYKECCGLMKRMRRLGGEDTVEKLISELRQTYPRRPALMDELKKLKA